MRGHGAASGVFSGGLSGVCLLVLAAAAFATDDVRRRLDHLDEVERKVDALYRLLTEEAPVESGAGDVVAVDGGTSYHRPQCRLVQGKSSTHALTASRRAGCAPRRDCRRPEPC